MMKEKRGLDRIMVTGRKGKRLCCEDIKVIDTLLFTTLVARKDNLCCPEEDARRSLCT